MSDSDEHRKHSRMRLELPVEVQVDGGGFRNVQIVDISPTGLQLWTDDTTDFESASTVEFEVRFKAKMAWSQPMEDRSHLTGWEIEVGSVTSVKSPFRHSPDDVGAYWLIDGGGGETPHAVFGWLPRLIQSEAPFTMSE